MTLVEYLAERNGKARKETRETRAAGSNRANDLLNDSLGERDADSRQKQESLRDSKESRALFLGRSPSPLQRLSLRDPLARSSRNDPRKATSHSKGAETDERDVKLNLGDGVGEGESDDKDRKEMTTSRNMSQWGADGNPKDKRGLSPKGQSRQSRMRGSMLGVTRGPGKVDKIADTTFSLDRVRRRESLGLEHAEEREEKEREREKGEREREKEKEKKEREKPVRNGSHIVRPLSALAPIEADDPGVTDASSIARKILSPFRSRPSAGEEEENKEGKSEAVQRDGVGAFAREEAVSLSQKGPRSLVGSSLRLPLHSAGDSLSRALSEWMRSHYYSFIHDQVHSAVIAATDPHVLRDYYRKAAARLTREMFASVPPLGTDAVVAYFGNLPDLELFQLCDFIIGATDEATLRNDRDEISEKKKRSRAIERLCYAYILLGGSTKALERASHHEAARLGRHGIKLLAGLDVSQIQCENDEVVKESKIPLKVSRPIGECLEYLHIQSALTYSRAADFIGDKESAEKELELVLEGGGLVLADRVKLITQLCILHEAASPLNKQKAIRRAMEGCEGERPNFARILLLLSCFLLSVLCVFS